MEKEFFLVILAYFGLVLGIIISYLVKEEILPGQKYFRIIKAISLSYIIYNFSQLYLETTFSILISLTTLIVISILEFKTRNYLKETLISAVLGFMIYKITSPLTAYLIFIYYLAQPSEWLAPRLKESIFVNLKKSLIVNLSYFLVYIGVYLIS